MKVLWLGLLCHLLSQQLCSSHDIVPTRYTSNEKESVSKEKQAEVLQLVSSLKHGWEEDVDFDSSSYDFGIKDHRHLKELFATLRIAQAVGPTSKGASSKGPKAAKTGTKSPKSKSPKSSKGSPIFDCIPPNETKAPKSKKSKNSKAPSPKGSSKTKGSTKVPKESKSPKGSKGSKGKVCPPNACKGFPQCTTEAGISGIVMCVLLGDANLETGTDDIFFEICVPTYLTQIAVDNGAQCGSCGRAGPTFEPIDIPTVAPVPSAAPVPTTAPAPTRSPNPLVPPTTNAPVLIVPTPSPTKPLPPACTDVIPCTRALYGDPGIKVCAALPGGRNLELCVKQEVVPKLLQLGATCGLCENTGPTSAPDPGPPPECENSKFCRLRFGGRRIRGYYVCFEKVVPRLQRSICIPEPLIDRALAAGGECELCPPPPTPRPTRGPVQSLPPANVCPGDRNQCSEDNPEYVWFCFCTGCRGAQKQCSTLCIKKEDAAPLLLDPCNSCGRCETFTNCDLFPCGNNDEKVQICHYAIGNGNQPGGYETLCISKSALVGHLDPPPPHCDHCGACLPSPPDPATCTKT